MINMDMNLPEEVIWDLESGYAINVPLGYQDYPGWQLDNPDVIERIGILRTQMGILIRDDFFMAPEFNEEPYLYANPLEEEIERRGLQGLVDEIMAIKSGKRGIETKARRPTVRHVRTPAGARHYNQPIGTVIVADTQLTNFRELPSMWDGYVRYRGANAFNYWSYQEGNRWYVVDDDNNDLYDASSEVEMLQWIDEDARDPRAKDYRGVRNAPEGFHAADIEERLATKVPPAWVDVFINDDKDAALVAVGYDGKDRKQSLYSAKHTRDQADKKYTHMESMHKYMPALDRAIRADWSTNDDARALMLIRKMGMRPGSTSDTRAAEQAFGATTLEARHVRLNKDSVTFTFTGKKGVQISLNSKDPEILEMMRSQMRGKSRRDLVFPNSNSTTVAGYLKSKTSDKVKLKDLRTYRANEVALAAIKRIKRKPKTETEFRNMRNAVGDSVAAILGNSRTMALNSYINPTVFYAIAEDPNWLEKIISKQRKEDV
jgi:DNA topoisomerase I